MESVNNEETMSEINANALADKMAMSTLGAASGDKKIIFGRDYTNMLPYILNLSLALMREEQERMNEPAQVCEATGKLAMVLDGVYGTAARGRTEVVTHVRQLLEQAGDDEDAYAVLSRFSMLFFVSSLSVMAVLPNMGAGLPDDLYAEETFLSGLVHTVFNMMEERDLKTFMRLFGADAHLSTVAQARLVEEAGRSLDVVIRAAKNAAEKRRRA
jgi:hypothetical protein